LVLDLESSSTKLYALYNPNGVVVESIAGLTAAPQLVAQLNGVSGASLKVLDSGGSSLVAVGTTNNGVQMWDASSWSSILPNAPLSNLFISLAVDRNGALWCGTGMSSGAKGFYRFDPSKSESLQWKNFSTAQYPVMRGDAYYKASIGVAGSVWMSSWGYGVAEVVGDQIVRVLDSTSTPKVQSVDNTSHFPVPGGVAVDAAGSQWIAIRTAYDGNSLVKLNPDNSFSYIRNGYNAFDTYFHSLVIDRNGTKWFGNSEPDNKNARGLYYYNESNIVSGTSAFGGWGFISTSDGLPHNTVIALAVDLEGDVWVGTDLGCMIILNPLSPRLASNRQTVFALREQSIQTIAVDAVDNKWVGTREGVFVMNPDGTQLLEQYRVENTDGKLLDNDVRSIAIDQKRGVVYIGTQKGLSSLSIAAVQTQRSFATIDVAPNPFLIPEMAQVAILNLVANSSVKILNTNGTLVQQFKAQGGGRAFWDGRDSFGNLVGSGVYFIVAYAENGNQVASGKVAVILK
jgi:ligand-binding sensor domain-containing protein